LALGVILGASRRFSLMSNIHATLIVTIMVVGFFIVSLPAKLLEFPHPHALDVVLALGGIAGVVALALLTSRANLDIVIRFLGRHSLEIFVAHSIISGAIRILLQKIGHISSPAPYLIFCTLAGLYIPAVVALGLERVGVNYLFFLPKRSSEPKDLRYAVKASPCEAADEQTVGPLN